MQSVHLLSESERKLALREAILRRAPGISLDKLDLICESVNTKRRYYIKATSNIERFMNLVTRETIITEETHAFCEVLPLYGNFTPPYFEKKRGKRYAIDGKSDSCVSAAAVKIRTGLDKQRFSVTYFLILYLSECDNLEHDL